MPLGEPVTVFEDFFGSCRKCLFWIRWIGFVEVLVELDEKIGAIEG